MSSSTIDPVAGLRAVLQQGPAALAFVRQAQFEMLGEPFEDLFSYPGHAPLAGQPTRAVMTSDAAHANLQGQLAAAFSAGVALDAEVELRRCDGARFWARLRAAPLQWDQPTGDALWSVEDVTQARRQRMQPQWQALHDPLTELANRHEFERRLTDHLTLRRRQPVSVLMIDIDDFAAVNTTLGQEGGNRALHTIGARLLSKVRASDLVARLEADCFVVLLPDCELHYALLLAEKLCDQVSRDRLRTGVKSIRVTASVGAIQLEPHLNTTQRVVDACAEAVRSAKAEGGNTVRWAGRLESVPSEALHS